MWPITVDKTRDRTPGLLDRGGKSIHEGGPSWPSGDVVQVLDLFGFFSLWVGVIGLLLH